MNAKRGCAYAPYNGIFADFFALSFPLPALAEEDTACAGGRCAFALAQGEYAAVYDDSDAAMQSALGDADGLAAVWAQLTGMLGALTDVQTTDAGAQGDYRVAVAECAFENADAADAGLRRAGTARLPRPCGYARAR